MIPIYISALNPNSVQTDNELQRALHELQTYIADPHWSNAFREPTVLRFARIRALLEIAVDPVFHRHNLISALTVEAAGLLLQQLKAIDLNCPKSKPAHCSPQRWERLQNRGEVIQTLQDFFRYRIYFALSEV